MGKDMIPTALTPPVIHTTTAGTQPTSPSLRQSIAFEQKPHDHSNLAQLRPRQIFS